MARALDDEGSVWALDLGMVNAYLLDDGTVTLVDAGTPGAVDDLRAELDGAGYDRSAIERVLVTHFDFDHVGGLAPLGLDAPIYAMEPDASFLDGSRRPPLGNKKGLLQRATDFLLTRPEGPIQRVGDEATVGGFTAYHTPGHSPGHAVFHHPGLRVALLGDLVAEDGGELGTPPWPLAYSNTQNRQSVRALARRNLSFEIACMGHGAPLAAGGAEALAALADRYR
jgi:glyoxylase-like metal-dependent hydrolase (beta-lactamase superfamily II)